MGILVQMVTTNKVNPSKSYLGKREAHERYIVDISLKFMLHTDYLLLTGALEPWKKFQVSDK